MTQKTAQGKARIGLPTSRRSDEFRPIADLITPNPPDWLAEELCRWAPTVYLNAAANERQPTRAKMVDILHRALDAALLLRRAIDQSSEREFLDAGGNTPIPERGKLQAFLSDLYTRADRASKLPSLVNKRGKTKSGRGVALLDGAISGKTYCALLIAEAWTWFHRTSPPPRSRQASKAVDLYWELAVGKEISWGNDPLTAWRHHFIEAAALPAQEDRAEFQRHMREAERQAEYRMTGDAIAVNNLTK